MYSVYVLRSVPNRKRYVGYTSQKVTARLGQHNSGHNRWTAQNGPFELVRVEEFEQKADAKTRERYLKTGVGRRELDHLVGR